MNKGIAAECGNETQMWPVVSREALIAGYKEDGRTVYRREGKAKLVAAATAPGASVAKLAREHGLNANQLHVWIRQSRRPGTLKAGSVRRAAKVATGLERAAIARATNTLDTAAAAPAVRLVPVAMMESSNAPLNDPSEALTDPNASTPPTSPRESKRSKRSKRSTLIIEIGGARIVVEGAQIERDALSAVIACLRDTQAQ
jgi:transposase-like protein